MIKQDISGNRANLIYLGIGSNLGNRKNNIEKAKFELFQDNFKIIKLSNYYESESWPDPSNPKYLNIVLEALTTLSPSKLLKKCKDIEKILGRKERSKNAPRECDIDIIDYNNKNIRKNIILPHPRMHTRNFVLLPLYEINKDWKHPVFNHSINKMILSLSNRDIRSIKQV